MGEAPGAKARAYTSPLQLPLRYKYGFYEIQHERNHLHIMGRIAGIENSQLIFNFVFFVVLTSALIQDSTISWLAEKLDLLGDKKAAVPHTL
jgi:hypothetical protein